MAYICPFLPHSPTLFLVRTLVFLEDGPLGAHDQFLPGQCPGGLRPQPGRSESCPTGDRLGPKKGTFSLSSRFATTDDRSPVICGHALPSPLQGEEKAPTGGAESGQGGGSSGATLLRADSSSQVPVITDKVMSRKPTPLNSNLIIASHMDIKASQRAAALCAGGEIGIFRH